MFSKGDEGGGVEVFVFKILEGITQPSDVLKTEVALKIRELYELELSQLRKNTQGIFNSLVCPSCGQEDQQDFLNNYIDRSFIPIMLRVLIDIFWFINNHLAFVKSRIKQDVPVWRDESYPSDSIQFRILSSKCFSQQYGESSPSVNTSPSWSSGKENAAETVLNRNSTPMQFPSYLETEFPENCKVNETNKIADSSRPRSYSTSWKTKIDTRLCDIASVPNIRHSMFEKDRETNYLRVIRELSREDRCSDGSGSLFRVVDRE